MRALLVGLLLLAPGACAPRCRNDVARRVAAPDASQDVVVYHRSCGERQGASTEVTLLPHDADLPDLPTSVLTLAQPVEVQAAWSGPDSLALTYPAGARLVAHLDRSPDGVTVMVRTR